MIEVEQRSFITKEMYERLVKKFDNIKSTSQITYYFKGDADLRIMLTKDFTKLWLKRGKIHDDAREEMEVIIDNQYREDLLKIITTLGYEIEIKWFRKRNELSYKDYYLTIDYTVGYGYIIEIEKKVTKGTDIDNIKQELIKELQDLGIIISEKQEFNTKYEDYKTNFIKYISDINESEFLNN